MKVNLIKESSQTYSINWIEVLIVLTLVLFMLGIGFHYYVLYSQNMVLETDVRNLGNQLNNLRIRVVQYNKLKNKVNELERIKEKMDTLRYVWDDAIIEQGYVIPENVMLSNLTIEKFNLSLTGRANDNQKVLELIKNMKLSPQYKDVKIISLNQANDANFSLQAVIVETGDNDV